MRILAVDYGERRTGLAVSDELGITAQGLDTLVRRPGTDLAAEICAVIAERNVGRIVLGLPLNMNGTESEMSEKVRLFAVTLEEMSGLPIIFWDERMTSMQAHRVMLELGRKQRGNKEEVDRISATLMLQEFLKTVV